ncbi:MAG TPA: hypothetical protein ENN73_06220 [Firmicutes bacterium]|nr:hypothetical protein [Bacillota bacterium]
MFILLDDAIYNLYQFVSILKASDGIFGITNTGTKILLKMSNPTAERLEKLFKEITYILDGNKSGLYVIEL